MSYTATYKKLDGSEAEFIGEISADAFESYRSHAIGHLSNNIEVKGFRKGKAPENVIAGMIPEMAILEEMANHAIMEAYPKMLGEHKVNAIGAPAVQITKIAKGSPLAFTLRTAVMPEITLPDYKKIAKEENKETPVEVTDAELEEALKQVQRMRAQGIEENKARAAGETKTAETTSDTAIETAAEGTDEKKEEELPELTDEFVQTLGEFTTVEDFKTKFKENMKLEKENRARETNRLGIMEKILEGTTGAIPNILIEAELDRMADRMKADIQGMGLSYDDYMKHLGKTNAEMRGELRPDAEKRVKMELLMSEIATKESITPDAEQVSKESTEILSQYPGADKNRVKEYVEQVLTNEKVFKLLEGK
jgi:trigger factor